MVASEGQPGDIHHEGTKNTKILKLKNLRPS